MGPLTVTRRHALALAAGLVSLSRPARAVPPVRPRRIAAIDWAALETVLALGVVPVAATELIQFRKTVVEPAVPDRVIDIGLRGTPNYEALTLAEPDLILTSNYYEVQRRNLERVAETLSLSVYQPGLRPYPVAEEVTLTLGRLLGREAEARAVVAATGAGIARLRDGLRGVARRPVLAINFGDARHFRAFGGDSMFGEVLRRLGIENAWATESSYSAAAPLGIEALARLPDAALIVVPPIPVAVTRALADSALWQALPTVREKRVSTIGPVNHFGALPAALRFARLVSAALLRQEGRRHG
ncbi:ABC transporter substrate-binding protein [Azospirillum sp. RWY-5-1]|uniref:ABC transporter substrate-binding protein n=1 Tax=Azospirillum oleiclasticum TaxID=2735135 RepID=A0ABX2TJ26_9PROT|nr:ABC transporter substrate-binding protein [Azospirillum oleiclasticum]NYZ14569.1 ABC transporter substrate-binding protein [Azospirillum oleiclasticum]NYZ24347.1 ABC transporter substrate-binding protein [Azospirillum oleiclasticum]